MSSESHRKTTRTISIAMIMLVSALSPMAVPASAMHGTSDPLVLEMQDDSGNWTGVPEFVDPITGNGDFLEPGMYEFRFTASDLTLNDSYELDWEVEVCEFFAFECDEPVSESRSWNAMGTSSTESWNLTLDIMDCDVSIHAYLSNETSGDSFEYEWDLLGPCGNTGDITLELDLDDDGVDEVVQGFDFEQNLTLSAGDYAASFNVSNLSSTGSYNMTWFVDLESENYGFEGEANWTGTDPGNALDFNLEIQITTCDFMILAVLGDESAGEDISAFVAMARGPCVQPITVSIYDEESGEWVEMGGTMPEADYEDCFWSDEEVLWWCGEDTDGDGTLDYTETWWYYCELSDYGWLCTDYFGQSEDHEFTENNTLLQPMFLEEGTYEVLVNLSALNATTHYAVHLGHLNPEYMEFNSTTENYSISAELPVSITDCNEWFQISVFDDPSDYPNEMPTFFTGLTYMGPCEELPSRFNLTYDGMEYEMEYEYNTYDDCTDDGHGWECEVGHDYDNDGETDDYDYDHFPYEACEFSEDDMVWYCENMVDPQIDAGNHTMEITVEGLEPGMNYSLEINSYMWGMYSGNDDMTIEVDFTADSDVMSEEFVIEVMNSTCNVNIGVQLHEENYYGGHSHVAHDNFNFQAPCGMETDFPVDLGLEVDDGGWTTINPAPLDLFFSSDEDDVSDEDMLMLMLDNFGYVFEEGNWSMRWTMDGLTNGSEYMLEVEVENPMMGDSGERVFFCGNGDEIPFYWVNDGYDDCEDGADEQQYDEDGDPINWFDCMDGSEVWIYQVNDGHDDCPDGDDEYSGSYGSGEEFHYYTATDDHGHIEWNLEVTEETCFMVLNAALLEMEEGHMVSMVLVMVMGPMAAIDDNGDEIPDCIEMMMSDGEGGGGPDWDMDDFAIGRNYEAVLEYVDFDESLNESHVGLFVAQHTIMHDDLRLKIDHDFFNGDDYLNDTEAMEFEMLWQTNALTNGCDESGPNFTVNGFDVDCAEQMQMFEGLANESGDEAIVWIAGWTLHYSNVTANDNGELIVFFAGDGGSGDPEEFSGTICGSAGELSGMVPVSWSYNGSAVESDCVEFEAGDHIESIEITFGAIDSDGDGYNDIEDRFPNDPEEWADSDDDGYGDNHDMFPDDPTEHWDSDGDGYGDNGDEYPWDAGEWVDSDADGYGDNSDAFPTDPTEWADTDGDGTGDNADTDADGDGVSDSEEDSDGDGVNDDQDDFPFDANETTDSDGDGVGDNSDAFPDDANETTDTDNDGIGDNSDEDVDGDGVTNDLDDFPLDSGQTSDTDGDGVGDSEDAFPNDPNEYADSDGDGLGDNADDDDDNDGVADTSDAFPTNPNESRDTDGDGYGDNADAFPNDAGEWNDYDGDGVGDNSDAFMTDPYESRDTDGDGLGDNADAFPNDPNEKVDSDGDGVGNNADAFPTDPSETTDTDGDGVGDNADDDADGDGVPDEPVDTVDDGDSGGILPGFTALTGLASVLGAAILVAGRRKD